MLHLIAATAKPLADLAILSSTRQQSLFSHSNSGAVALRNRSKQC
jgi:hypothetical protein